MRYCNVLLYVRQMNKTNLKVYACVCMCVCVCEERETRGGEMECVAKKKSSKQNKTMERILPKS